MENKDLISKHQQRDLIKPYMKQGFEDKVVDLDTGNIYNKNVRLSELMPGKTYVCSSSGVRFLFIEKHKQGTPKYIGDNSSEEKERYGLYYNPVTGCQQEIELFEYPIYVEVE